MNTSKYISKTIQFLKDSITRTNKESQLKNELIHPRFELTTTNASIKKEVPDTLLFLMYSKENEALFI
ncbi:hypothetical protein [Flavobacterium sp. 123]|jgi:hypothetical protein|uniref:hypothetical protein n=1 Tax=Flavobacterium sp. 123 TaxID=2135627 RepID=UPI000EB4BF68|nr:hypothetical protein [Flavobacterium sp. 123]RKS99815.1 hypothetical protein C8C88_1617 [Flavobacterium sp. 123]